MELWFATLSSLAKQYYNLGVAVSSLAETLLWSVKNQQITPVGTQLDMVLICLLSSYKWASFHDQ